MRRRVGSGRASVRAVRPGRPASDDARLSRAARDRRIRSRLFHPAQQRGHHGIGPRAPVRLGLGRAQHDARYGHGTRTCPDGARVRCRRRCATDAPHSGPRLFLTPRGSWAQRRPLRCCQRPASVDLSPDLCLQRSDRGNQKGLTDPPNPAPVAVGAAIQWIDVFVNALLRACADAAAFADRLDQLEGHWREAASLVRRSSATDRLLSALPGIPILTVETAAEACPSQEVHVRARYE